MVNAKYSRFVGRGRVVGRIPWTDTTFLKNVLTCEHAYNFFALKNTPRGMLKLPCNKK